jgi:hypothetical protein
MSLEQQNFYWHRTSYVIAWAPEPVRFVMHVQPFGSPSIFLKLTTGGLEIYLI